MPTARRFVHLVRRWWGSLSSAPPTATDQRWAEERLTSGEIVLFATMSAPDRRHAITVARRFEMLLPDASRDQLAAALLHDVGKTVSDLSTFERVVATLVGGRTRRLRQYRDHEVFGLEMCREAGSSEQTLALLRGDDRAEIVDALRRADDI